MKKMILLVALFLAACAPPVSLGDTLSTELAPPVANILVTTMSGDYWYCDRMDETTRVAKDCVSRDKITIASELHLGPNDTWAVLDGN